MTFAGWRFCFSMDGLVSVCLTAVQLVWPVKEDMTTILEDSVFYVLS